MQALRKAAAVFACVGLLGAGPALAQGAGGGGGGGAGGGGAGGAGGASGSNIDPRSPGGTAHPGEETDPAHHEPQPGEKALREVQDGGAGAQGTGSSGEKEQQESEENEESDVGGPR